MRLVQIVNVFVQQEEKFVSKNVVLQGHIVPEVGRHPFVKLAMQNWKYGTLRKMIVFVKPDGINAMAFVVQVRRFVKELGLKLYAKSVLITR